MLSFCWFECCMGSIRIPHWPDYFMGLGLDTTVKLGFQKAVNGAFENGQLAVKEMLSTWDDDNR